MAPKKPPSGKNAAVSSRGNGAARISSAARRLTRNTGLPVSLSGEGTKALLAQAALENRQEVAKMQRLHVIFEALLRLPASEAAQRLLIVDDCEDCFNGIKLQEAMSSCTLYEVLYRQNICDLEASDRGLMAVSSASMLSAILLEKHLKEKAAKQALAKKPLVAALVARMPTEELTGRVMRRRHQADSELLRREELAVEELRKVDSTALAKKNAEQARSERRAQLEAFRTELQSLVQVPATKETSERDIARLADVTNKRLALVQKESAFNAKRKDGRGDHRQYFEKDRDALITAIEARIRKIEEMEERATFREEEERHRLERARKLKGIDIAVLAGEKSVLEIHTKRELELAQLEADEVVDELLYRQMSNATGKEFHENIKAHEKAFLKLNRKLEALNGPCGGGNKSPSGKLPDINKGGWNIQSPRRGYAGQFSII
jgi:hypothetical protein